MADSSYRATLSELFQRRRFGLRPGLEVIRALLGDLGRPQDRFTAIHVTGSKGKGSVSAFAAGILQSLDLKVGLFTSPHLTSYRERIQIDRSPIDPSSVVEGVRRVEEVARRLLESGGIPHEPTFFEVTTAVAFDYFARHGVAHAVVEVGLGGRLDSTNVLNAPVGVITTIEEEHTEILGPTLTDVAREKAGILHRGMAGVVGEPKAEPLAQIAHTASTLGVPLWRLGREIKVEDRELSPRGQRFSVRTPHGHVDRIDTRLLGTFQPGNVALALAAVQLYAKAVGLTLTDEAVRRGVRSTNWRGRLERAARDPDLFLDVAHTPESARAVAASLAEIAPMADPAENAVLFGILRGKRVGEILDALAPLAKTVVVVPIRSDRTADPDDVRREASGFFPRVVQAPSSAEGLLLARAATGREGFTLAVGSDYLIGEILQRLEGGAEDEPDLSDPTLRAPGRESSGPSAAAARGTP